MNWVVKFEPERIDLHTPGRISEEDARRQVATVEEILKRLEHQPGLILADEVGMGKTFVALAVAISVAWARPEADPVVVMVPPSLKDKWPRDFEVFRARCLRRPGDRSERVLRVGRADSGLDFFRMLDDPKSRRKQIIFLSHGALSRGLADPWTKLAILQAALRARPLVKHRGVFHRFAGALLQVGSRFPDDTMFRELLDTTVSNWRAILRQYGESLHDDPVPTAISEILAGGNVELDALTAQLRALPLRYSEYLKDRLSDLRWALKEPLGQVWHQALARASFQSPLLVLDEAHHLKNPATQLASLFVEPEAKDEADLLDGALKGRFERMLFLTATPFQLGHRELLNVLDRFRGIRWQSDAAGSTLQGFTSAMVTLARALDEAQFTASTLDEKWSLLTPEQVAAGKGLDDWWRGAVATPEAQGEKFQVVHRAYAAARARLAEAERLLRPWVIRHTRPRRLPNSGEQRRRLLTGAAISGPDQGDSGLAVGEDALLPFLLAARCEAALTARTTEVLLRQTGRTVFAEGLASSYEAYLDTRKPPCDKAQSMVLDEDQGDGVAVLDEVRAAGWYMDRLERALPDAMSFQDHPKISATVAEAIRLWRVGEKVLIFCHFRKTGRSLRAHLSAALDSHIKEVASAKLGCDIGDVDRELESVGRLFDPRRPLHRQFTEVVRDTLGPYHELTSAERGKVEDVVRRFVRTPSFLVRYFPLGKRRTSGLLADAFAQADESGVSLGQKLSRFGEFIARRCEAPERAEYLAALDAIQTGLRYARDEGGDAGQKLLPNVHLANGEVRDDQRRRLLLAFNAPFFPEILIASSVLAEGVDLHLDCRYVIHHDLSWNPSTLEQRTGRVDRIGCKAEQVAKPITVYLPFVGGTQDEKMYRVVRDRERWFQVVMGEKYALDEFSLERMANRVPLPEVAAKELAFRLEVYRGQKAVA